MSSLLLLALLATGQGPEVVAEPPALARRIALVAAAHDGGPGRVRLRHASADARAFADVLVELGGVAPEDVLMAVDVDQAGLERALVELDERARATRRRGGRVEVVFYYSGHSDAEGLLLGGEEYPYTALRAALEGLDADVRLAVLDSCLSGSMIREKGGRHLPPFLLDESQRVQGTAVITSSSDDEVAQESDALGASFFTHAFVTGLRGGADASGDGQITLHEAYRFAFDETLARTEIANGGAQHPAYDMRLSGSGDLVLTDLRELSAGLKLEGALAGRVSVRDEKGRLVAELHKPAGEERLLGLPVGRYSVRVLGEGGAREGQVELADGARVPLLLDELDEVALTLARARGGDVTFFPVNLAFLTPLELNSFADNGAENLIGLHLLFGRQARLTGFDLALGVNFVDGDARGGMLGIGGNIVGGDLVGASVGALGNIVMGDVMGGQIAPGFNLAMGDVLGAQVAAGINLALEDVAGAQVAAISNFALGDVTLAQVAPGVNIGLGTTRGFALGVGNVHRRVEGAELGVINVAAEIAGLQLGVVNVAGDVQGPQLGIVNVARSSPFSLGLLNLVADGVHHLGVFSTAFLPIGARLQLGGEHLYTAANFGVSPWWDEEETYQALSLSLGGRVPFEVLGGSFFTDIEATVGNVPRPVSRFFHQEGVALDTSARVLLGWRPIPYFTVAAGPALHVLVYDEQFDASRLPVAATFEGPVSTSLAPGFALYFGL